MSLERARRSVRLLLEVAPEMAERIQSSGSSSIVPAREIEVGDRILVRAGSRVPIDGTIKVGRSSLDQKAITGESIPVSRGPGDEVFAGSVNGDGAIEVEATREAFDTVAARTVALVREAQAAKTPIERSIDQFASWYTPVVFAGALVVMIGPPIARAFLGVTPEWGTWFARGLVVLVAACPCALVIGTPVAVVSALAGAARRGVLIKGGAVLEAVGRLKVLAFDKTGTLTRGEPDVVEVVSAGVSEDEGGMLRVAAALGDRGGHPLGRAIARHARELRLDVPAAEGYQAVPGLGARGNIGAIEYHVGNHRYLDESGLCGEGLFHNQLLAAEGANGTAVAVSSNAGPLGYIRLSDLPRAEAAGVVRELERLGLHVVMLTGDNVATAAAMAAQLGVGDYRASLLPADKARIVNELGVDYGPTGMVGDGVNDAPALAAARVGIAIGGASSAAAMEAADAVLMADDLSRLPWLIQQSRRTLARIQQNIVLALTAKALVLVLAILGYAGMWMAIAADVGVTLVVIANALRLLQKRE
jgi:Zn2+/Cd2+-exporting ATPase